MDKGCHAGVLAAVGDNGDGVQKAISEKNFVQVFYRQTRRRGNGVWAFPCVPDIEKDHGWMVSVSEDAIAVGLSS